MQSRQKRAYLPTSRLDVGKTSLVREVVPLLGGRGGGFYTEEVRRQGTGIRFCIHALDGGDVLVRWISLADRGGFE